MINDGTPGSEPLSGRVSAWLSEIEKARSDDGMTKYEKRCDAIRKRYRYEGSAFVRTRQYQLLWSNIETMKSAVYSKPPHSVVSRRYRDADPVGRIASEILERGINFSFDTSDFDGVFKQVRDDFLLYARGVARVYYEPEYETKNDLNEDISDARSDNSRETKNPSMAATYAHAGGSVPMAESSSESDEAKTIAFGNSRSRSFYPNSYHSKEESGKGRESAMEAADDVQQIAFENVRIRFLQRSDFRHQPARTWEEVNWVAFRSFMTRAEVSERFGEEIGKSISLDCNPVDVDDGDHRSFSSVAESGAKATIWEIWDKAKNKVLWIAKSWPDVLEEGEPYLVLDGFYPCPRPAYGTLTPDSLVPIPDFVFYQDQSEEIDQLTARIAALSDALKVVGFYAGGPQGEGAPEIEKAFAAGFENKIIEVKGWSSFLQGGGGSGPPIVWLPIDQVIKVLEGCVKLRQQLLEDVYQIVGISDIMRGATDPQETMGAQQLKAQFGGKRVRDRQQEMARFCRDIGRLTGQILATYCSPETIMKMTNISLPTQQDVEMPQLQAQLQAQLQEQQAQQAAMMQDQQGMLNGAAPNGNVGVAPDQGTPQPGGVGNVGQAPAFQAPPTPDFGPTQEQVFGLLKDSLNRLFKIDIENDSTIEGDESQEKQDRTQFIDSVTRFMETWGPMVIRMPQLAPLSGQMLLFGVRAFRIGRELEEVIEETIDNLTEMGKAPPGPDPKIQSEQIKLQGTHAKTQAEIAKSQIDAQTAQQSAQAKVQGIQAQSEAKIAELRMKLALAEQEHAHRIAQGQLEHGAAVDKMALAAQKQQTAALAQAAKPPTWPVNERGF